MTREVIATGSDKRYVRRDSQGRFVERDDIGRSLAKRTPSGGQTSQKVHQLALDSWPSGLDVEALQVSLWPDQIAGRSGIVFEEGHDSLDDFDAALVDLGGQVFALQSHRNSPAVGTTVLVSKGGADALWSIANLLKLKPKEVTWVSPDFCVWRRQFKQRSKAAPVTLAALATAATAAAAIKVVKRAASRTKKPNQKKLRA